LKARVLGTNFLNLPSVSGDFLYKSAVLEAHFLQRILYQLFFFPDEIKLKNTVNFCVFLVLMTSNYFVTQKNVIFPRNLACYAATNRSIFVIMRIKLWVTMRKLQFCHSEKMSFFREIFSDFLFILSDSVDLFIILFPWHWENKLQKAQQIGQFSSFWKFWKVLNYFDIFRIFIQNLILKMTKIDWFVDA